MAAVSCRTLYIVKWYELSRVLSVSSTLATTQRYRKETWCRRWRHISQRSFSLTATSFAPSLSPIFMGMESGKPTSHARKSSKTSGTAEAKKTTPETTESADKQVTVTYHRGLPRITVPLPSRKEHCVFILKPITHTVGDFIEMLKQEDRGIDRATLTTIDGVRISSNNTIESLMEDDFRLIINDNEYLVSTPLLYEKPMENMQKLSDIKTLVGDLYEMLHVREHHAETEKHVITELEAIRLELEPLEKEVLEVADAASKSALINMWLCLFLMAVKFGALARLTWWEYSWDIMEPVTYFITYATGMSLVVYFLVTKQEYILSNVLDRRYLIAFHKRAKQVGLDLDTYNRLKDRAYELEITLKTIRGPLFDYKTQMERAKRARSSSSSSRSPSSSPSPSPSPSPERSVPKRHITSEKGSAEKWIPHLNRFR